MMRGCLIGQDVRYSYSKKIHEALLSSYDLISLKKEDINDFLHNNNYDFINVTIPYKEEVLKYLDVITPNVKKIGACNLIKKENNKLVGYNTDYDGFLKALEYDNIKLSGHNVLLLGSGGAAKAISAVFLDHGSRVSIVSRNNKDLINYEEANHNIDKFDIVVNATPNGMYPNISDMPLIKIGANNDIIIDIIYNPRRTIFLQDGEMINKKIMNGIPMLVFQALAAYNQDLSNEAKALIDLLNKENNIVLIGMPYCGKSALGKDLLKKFPERDLYDIDEIIEEKYGKITDIFKNGGEEKFRDYEESVIKEIALKNNAIIVPGGGFFKRSNNIKLLKCNGLFYYLKRELNDIYNNFVQTKDKNRPLIKDINDLERIYKERTAVYESIKDIVVDGDFDDYYSC